MNNFIINVLNDQIKYIHPMSGEGMTAVMLDQSIPEENETFGNLTQEEYQNSIYKLRDLSKRNERDSYIIPIENERVLLNFIPRKTVLKDNSLRYILNNEFEFFLTPDFTDSEPVPFSLENGTFFRVIGEGIRDIKDYQYYVIMDGTIQIIPNSKTLEVMLVERDTEYESIKVIEQSQFEELIRSLGQPE